MIEFIKRESRTEYFDIQVKGGLCVASGSRTVLTATDPEQLFEMLAKESGALSEGQWTFTKHLKSPVADE